MNKRYERYIEYIVNDIQAPYFINMKDSYGLRPDEYNLVLSKVFNEPVSIDDGFQKRVYNKRGFEIYVEDNDGDWSKWEYDANGNEIYGETSYGYWYKKEYDGQRNLVYSEDSYGYWRKWEYNDQGNEIYFEDSYGNIRDNR